jgi:hypothetical protein
LYLPTRAALRVIQSLTMRVLRESVSDIFSNRRGNWRLCYEKLFCTTEANLLGTKQRIACRDPHVAWNEGLLAYETLHQIAPIGKI